MNNEGKTADMMSPKCVILPNYSDISYDTSGKS